MTKTLNDKNIVISHDAPLNDIFTNDGRKEHFTNTGKDEGKRAYFTEVFGKKVIMMPQ